MLKSSLRNFAISLLLSSVCWQSLTAQAPYFAGAVGGIATISADGQSSLGSAAAVSSYKPENGPAFNGFAGMHLWEYVSLQGNYVWNRNSFRMTSVLAGDSAAVFYEQLRRSSQHGAFADLLLYFRNRQSRIRPYLSVGGGVVRFSSMAEMLTASGGTPLLPPIEFVSTEPALRVAVGIDLAISQGWSFRYTFSESIRGNPISTRLAPPGDRNLANFQNLFGFVKSF